LRKGSYLAKLWTFSFPESPVSLSRRMNVIHQNYVNSTPSLAHKVVIVLKESLTYHNDWISKPFHQAKNVVVIRGVSCYGRKAGLLHKYLRYLPNHIHKLFVIVTCSQRFLVRLS